MTSNDESNPEVARQVEVRPDDLDRTKAWVVVQLLAAIVALVALGTVGGSLLSKQIVGIEPGKVPEGRATILVEAPGGVTFTLMECPTPLEWAIGDREEICTVDSRRSVRYAASVMVVAFQGCAVLVVARRRRRWLKAERRRIESGDELVSYRHDAMPWAYWAVGCALAPIGVWVNVLVVAGLLRGDADHGVGGGLIWLGLLYLAWVYGRSRGYELRLVDDEIRWRAPLRSRSVPLESVTAVDLRSTGGVLAERDAVVEVASGKPMSVVVPDPGHERRFHAFAEAVRRRTPQPADRPLQPTG